MRIFSSTRPATHSRTTAFLQKPFTADQLLAKVRQVLDGAVRATDR